jgi:hypothetical protein
MSDRWRGRRLSRGRISMTILGAVVVLLVCPVVADALPDGRAIELVTPPETNGATPGTAVPAPGGEAVDFQAGPFGNTASGGNTLYQARRTVGGWETTALTPADVLPSKAFAHTAPLFFTPDLSKSIFTTEQPLVAGEDASGALNLFEESSQGALTLVSQGTQIGTGRDSATFDGATPEGDFVAFDSAEPLVPAANGLEESAYQTDDYLYVRDVPAGSTELDNVNNKGSLLNPEGAVLGNGDDLVFGEPSAPGEAAPFADLPADVFGTTTHAISANGSKVFFESPTPAVDEVELSSYRGREIHLYMRKEGKTTVRLDREVAAESEEEKEKEEEHEKAGESGPPGARYVGASENGAKVFFVSDEALAGDTFNDTELYVYNTEDEKVTPISVAPEGDPAVAGAVDGVTAIANDGSRVYYVADGKLADNANAADETATEGQPNLYVYDTVTDKNTFIGQLSLGEVESGGEPESGHAGNLTSYVDVERPAVPTPNGEVLVFVSRGDFTGEALDGTAQVYRYDATSEALTCISCGPTATGSASIGIVSGSPAGAIGGGSYDPPGQSAPMSSTGERIFFETESSLVPEDENAGAPPLELGVGESTQEIPDDVDVYEWENGHVYLISAGKPGLTRLQGVTPSGDDAFFTSSVSITGEAPAGYVNLYDARVGGVSASPHGAEGVSCVSIPSCQGALGEIPKFAVPGTSILTEVSPAPLAESAQQGTPTRHGKPTKHKHKRKKGRRKGKSHKVGGGKGHGAGGRVAPGSKRDGRVKR